MTAVAAIYTAEGFAIAADGRRSWSYHPTAVSHQFESEAVQKIFGIASDNLALAYFIRGDTVSEDGSWDIADELREAAKLVSAEEFDSCPRFVNALCATVQARIERAIRIRRLEGYPNTQICILGYFGETASWVDATFHPHLNEVGLRYYIWPRDCEGRVFLSGSEILNQMIVSGDTRVVAQLPFRTAGNSIQAAASFVRNYIETCCSPLIRQLEPDGCKTVGGHIHVATIAEPTKTSWLSKLFRKPDADGGFKWVTPPMGVTSSIAP
ncbi:MAG: hypothetical protein WCA27_11460 [Candidatus Sulfotelmatobacter sp.]